MKKILISLILLLFPAYRFITWILVSNDPNLHTQPDRLNAYHNRYFLGFHVEEPLATIVSVVLLVASLIFLVNAKKEQIVLKTGLSLVTAFLILFNTWSLL